MRFILFSLLFIGSVFTTRGQFAGWFTYDTTNSAIPSNIVTALEVDHENSIWVGTQDGLARFQDFFNWTIFNTSNSALPDNRVTALRQAPDLTIWIGTQNGLAVLSGNSFTVYNTSNSPLTSNAITAVAFEGSKAWITTDGGGFYGFDGTTWQVFNSASTGFNIQVCYDVAIDPLGNKWIASLSNGLLKVTGNVVTAFTPQNSQIPFSFVRSVAVENDTTIWLGMGFTDNDSALVKFNGTFDFQVFSALNSEGIAFRNVWDILVTAEGEKWICTNDLDYGAILYNDTVFTDFNAFTSGLPYNRVYCVAKDTANVWLGTLRGLAVYNVNNAFLSSQEVKPLLTSAPFPNPAISQISIPWNNGVHQARVGIYGTDGRLMMYRTLNDISEGLSKLDISFLAPGFYMASVQSGGRASHFKFIKQ